MFIENRNMRFTPEQNAQKKTYFELEILFNIM